MDLLDENELAGGGSAEGGPPVACLGISTQTQPSMEPMKIKKKSTKFPPLQTNLNIWTFLSQTMSEIKS